MRTTAGSDRLRQHMESQARGEQVVNLDLRCEEVVHWATRGGAKAIGLEDKIGSLEVGKRADVVLIKNDDSPVMFPIINAYGHIVMQAQRGDVDTVVIDGNILKNERKLVGIDLAAARNTTEKTVSYLVESVGEAAWVEGQNPELSERQVNANPYKYVN
jgi:cytosine/adenosine deaminase-related metal-dependent hydrolase